MQPWVSALALVLVSAWLEWGFRGGGAGLDATLIGPVTRVVSLTSASVGVHPSGMATLPWVLDLRTYVL